MKHLRKSGRTSIAVARLMFVAVMVVALLAAGLGAIGIAAGDSEADHTFQSAPINPDFVDYMENPPEPFYGYIPPPIELNVEEGLAPEVMLPASYDWRASGKVTSVKNQSTCGTCWAFGATSALESKVLIDESASYDFSEQSVALCVDRSWDYLYDGANDPCLAGGWGWLAGEAFIKKGAVLESCNPYNPGALNCDGACVCDSCTPVKKVDGYRLVTNDGSQIDTIKNAIYNQGPMTLVYYMNSGGEYCDPTYGAIYDYYPCSGISNHLISVIGWDDDVPHPNPSHTGTGAWLVKNSWGTADLWASGACVSDGYFYLAYGSSCVREIAYFEYKDHDPSESLLYWDEAGMVSSAGCGSPDAWMANVYTTGSAGDLTHVDFYTTSSNANYEIYVWDGSFGTQLRYQTGSCAEPGYYSIPLSSPLSLGAGAQFTLGVDMNTPGYSFPLPIEVLSTYANPPIQSGVSFIKCAAAEPWLDTADLDWNACLRARMSGEAVEAPDIDVTPTSLETTLLQGTTGDLTLNIANVGDAPLEVYNICDEEVTASEGTPVDPSVIGNLNSVPRQRTFAGSLPQNTTPASDSEAIEEMAIDPVGGSLVDCACDARYRTGDKVVALVDNPANASGILRGHTGTVVCGYSTGIPILISWDNWSDGHAGNGYCECPVAEAPDNSGWWVYCDDIAPYTADIDCACDARYSVGERVVALVDNPGGTSGILKGHTGTAFCGLTWDSKAILISWDDWQDGHNGNGHCECPTGDLPDNSGWWVYCDDIASLECACDPDALWMSVSPTSGTVGPGDDMDVTVSFDASGLSAGTHEGNIKIKSNDPDEGCTVVPVTLTVVCPPDIWVDPTEFNVTLPPDDSWTGYLDIHNDGCGTLTYSITDGQTTPTVSIPASDGNFPRGSAPDSIGPAPVAAAQTEEPAPTGFGGGEPVGSGEPAFAIDIYPGENLVYIPDTTVPGTWNIVGSVAGTGYFAGDFLLGDFSQMYVIDYYANTLYTLDTTTATSTAIGACAPLSGQWTGMTGATDGTLYACSTDITTSYLYTINPGTGAPTMVGQITNASGIIDIAINAAGEMYGVDILDNMLVRINPSNGAGTVVGSIGFDANYAQGMDFEQVSGVLYLAAYNTASGGELRIADTSSGNTALVGGFPDWHETDCLGFTTFPAEEPCPWLDENPKSGDVPPASFDTIEVIIDTTGLAAGDYYCEIVISNNDPDENPTIVPVHLTVIAGIAVTTDPPTNLTPTSVTLNGTLDSLGSASYVDIYFVIGLTSSYTHYVWVDRLFAAPDSFSYNIPSGLTPGTTYHYAAASVDNYGTLVYGNDVTFTYRQPTVTTDPPTNVTPTSATLNGTLDSLGSASYVDVYFVVGLTPSYTGYVWVDRLFAAPDSFSYNIPSGLTPGTTYHYAAVLRDNNGVIVYGNDVPFSYIKPTVTTDAATDVTSTSATFNGTLDSMGAASSVDVYFLAGIGTSCYYPIYAGTMTAPGPFSYDVSAGLTPGTTYSYRAVGVGDDGTIAYGHCVPFKTST